MTPEGSRHVEDLLRERLRAVDDVAPPRPDFDASALQAGRERLARRQAWKRGITGLAAAAVVAVLAVPAVGGLRTAVDGARPSTGSSAPQGASTATPGTATPGATTPGYAAPGAASPTAQGTLAAPGPLSPDAARPGGPDGAPPLDAGGPLTQATVARLAAELASAYPDTFTALVLETTPAPTRVVLHLTAETPAAERRVRDLVSPRVPVVVKWSAYSARSCATTLGRVAADRSTLATEGYAVESLACDEDGRVVLTLTSPVTTAQRDLLASRYGDPVTVVVSPAVPSTTNP